MENMKRLTIIGLILTLSFAGLAQAGAATKSSAVTATFKNLLNAAVNSLEELETQYELDVDALDANLAAATKAANDLYSQELLAAINLYAPQIDAANKKAADSKALYEANNKVKLSTGFFADADRLNWALDCLPARVTAVGKILKRYCGAVEGIPTFGESGYGGEDWQPGDITTIALRNADDKYVAIGLERGYIAPLNLLVFDSSRIAYKQGLADAADLTSRNGKARSAASTKRDNSIASATSVREAALEDLDEKFESDKAVLEAQQTAANLALLAAKRAAKDPGSFDSAFAVAYKFEYNRQMLGQIADEAWNGDWTFRTIDSIIKVNKLAATGDAIGRKYSMANAKAFNSAVGSAFTNEPDFRAAFKVLTATYKKTTNVTLKF
jgi:hypothetical protein